MTDNPLPSGTRLLSVGKLFTFNKKLIQLHLKFQPDYNLESILESFYSATNPALFGEEILAPETASSYLYSSIPSVP